MDPMIATLHRYLQQAREALLWKIDGVSEYDARRPLVPTGTNLLGLVKHMAGVEAAYFGETFGRPFPEPMPWMDDDAEWNADMWATPAESRDDIIALYRRVWAHADETIAALPADGAGTVAWWGDEPVTLHQILVHVTAEIHRHAGHADIVRELIDGEVGVRANLSNLPPAEREWWPGYHDRLEKAAQTFRD
ncbi:DinB family protein [Paractinoplanes atraurantiacus]|uniref:DinB superfamily protein n=1 Tax=Paractinoplanes atraurantiacus TaxID=1036182 RepID=A0A285K1Z6_9ACTN|nr:DinB family protein [Actinoplanes atraurantiacus]SNY66609.1 Protein of unknown function [Actinoplanes atraurantiacus]